MDFLSLVWTEFPELQKVIRTGNLPMCLALSPLDLVSWLTCLRTIGLSLEEFPALLPGFLENARPFSVATFLDGGPPVFGDASYIHDVFGEKEIRTAKDCPSYFNSRCCCYGMSSKKSCFGQEPISTLRLILDIDETFHPASYVDVSQFRHLTALGPVSPEITTTEIHATSRYSKTLYGILRLPENRVQPLSSVQEDVKSVSYDALSLRDYLRSISEYTVNTQLSTVFDDVTSVCSAFSEQSEVIMTPEEESWKKRPNES